MIISLALAFFSHPIQVPEEAPDQFRAEFERIEALADSGKWSSARAKLLGLLDDHESANYAWAKRTQIAEIMARCDFWSKHREPHPRTLVGGALTSYSRTTGQIDIHYEPQGRIRSNKAFRPKDFELDRDVYLHPLHFTGPHEFIVQGSMPEMLEPDQIRAPEILLGIGGGELIQISFGFPEIETPEGTLWIPPRVARVVDGKPVVLATGDNTKLELGAEYEIEVRLGRGVLIVLCDGEQIIRTDVPTEVVGRAGYSACPNLAGVQLSGRASNAWIEGLIDRESTRLWSEFEKNYEPARSLPAWLIGPAPEGGPKASVSSLRSYFSSISIDHIDAARELSGYFQRGEYEIGLKRCGSIRSTELSSELVAFFEALFLKGQGKHELALKVIRQLVGQAHDFAEALLMEAQLLSELGLRAEAAEAFSVLMLVHADNPSTHAQYARHLLSIGEADMARTVVDAAREVGLNSDELANIDSLLVRALQGPRWSSSNEYRSRHYYALSNLDRQACFDTSQILEESLDFFERRLRALPVSEGPRFRVFLFSGQSGFRSYIDKLEFGALPHNPAGIYNPNLKQLLIWKQNNPEALTKTIRHEGFHQYLDALLPTAPVWFNEGLAVYFEELQPGRGTLIDGLPHATYMSVLMEAGREWIPMDQLWTADSTRFYAQSKQHYAQSWAMIHYLLKAGEEEERLFQQMLDRLIARQPIDDLLRSLGTAEEIEELLYEHLTSLQNS